MSGEDVRPYCCRFANPHADRCPCGHYLTANYRCHGCGASKTQVATVIGSDAREVGQ